MTVYLIWYRNLFTLGHLNRLLAIPKSAIDADHYGPGLSPPPDVVLDPTDSKSSDDEIRCDSNSIVIRNNAIARIYPGGLRAFLDELLPNQSNEKISVFSATGAAAKRFWGFFHEYPFEEARDFVQVVIKLFEHPNEPIGFYPLDSPVKWLRTRYHQSAVFVSFIDSTPAWR